MSVEIFKKIMELNKSVGFESEPNFLFSCRRPLVLRSFILSIVYFSILLKAGEEKQSRWYFIVDCKCVVENPNRETVCCYKKKKISVANQFMIKSGVKITSNIWHRKKNWMSTSQTAVQPVFKTQLVWPFHALLNVITESSCLFLRNVNTWTTGWPPVVFQDNVFILHNSSVNLKQW